MLKIHRSVNRNIRHNGQHTAVHTYMHTIHYNTIQYHTYVHTYVHTHIQLCTCLMYVCMYVCTYVCIHTDIFTYCINLCHQIRRYAEASAFKSNGDAVLYCEYCVSLRHRPRAVLGSWLACTFGDHQTGVHVASSARWHIQGLGLVSSCL